MKKVVKVFIIVIFILINCIFLFNKTFYKKVYKSGNSEISIPRFSFFVKERGCAIATFYSLKSKSSLEKEINQLFKKDKFKNVKITSYKVSDTSWYRTIVIEYDPLLIAEE